MHVYEHYSVGNCGCVVRWFGNLSDNHLLWYLLPPKVRINRHCFSNVSNCLLSVVFDIRNFNIGVSRPAMYKLLGISTGTATRPEAL